MENFKKLLVWQKAHKLVLDIYVITAQFPKEEIYSLISQMRRSAISIPANIAEASKRNTNKDKIHFYTMSQTSLEELKYYFVLSYDLKYINKEKGIELTDYAREIGKMLNGLANTLK